MAKLRASKVTFADQMPKLDDLLCPGCKARFVIPLLLPCLHTLCKKCTDAEKISTKNGSLALCPFCSKPFDVKREFPVNFVVNNMVNAAALNAENSSVHFTCDSCESEDEKVTTRCDDCHLFLCEFCSTAHQRMSATKLHSLQVIEELREQVYNGKSLLRRPYFCPVHSSKPISHYCQTCEQIICHQCIRSQHQQHEIRNVKDIAKTFKVNIMNLTEQLKDKRKRVSEQVSLIQDDVKKLEGHNEEVQQNVEKYFYKLIEALRHRMNELVNEVNSRCKKKLETLLARQDTLQQTIGHIKNCCLFSEHAVKEGTEMEIISVGETVIEKLSSLVEEDEEMPVSNLVDKSGRLVEFVSESEKIMNDINHLGHVKEHFPSVPSDPSLCILSAAKQQQYILTGEVNRMSLTTVNQQGQRQKRGGDKVKISFSLANSRVTPENVGFRFGCQDNNDGTYVMAYAINKPDTYWLHVSINGFPVADSPVTVTVKPHDWISSQRMLRSENVGGLYNPYSVVVDSHDHLLVADSHNHRIKILSLTGELLKTFGTRGSFEGQFNFPYCLALNRRGNLVIVSDGQNNRVQIVTTSGRFVRAFGGFGEDVGRLNHPHGVAVDSADLIYVADSGNSRIQIFSPEGIPVGMIVSKDMACPWGLAISKSGYIVSTDYNLHQINVFNKDGSLSFRFGSRGSGNGHFNNPAGITIDEEGQFVVADRSNHRVQIFQPNGVFVTKFGGKGEGNGLMRFPAGVAVDKKGHLYVADTFNNRIQMFSLATV